MLPNFICPGAQKAGTYALFNLLKQHPDIFLPSCKETRFFFDESEFIKGMDWYEREFFSGVKRERMVGEITPEYMYFDYVPERIYDALGSDLKLIFMLRNPLDRALSHYWMSCRRGYEKESFKTAIDIEEQRIKKGQFEKNHFSYASRGLYASQIRRFLRYFRMDAMEFIIFDEFTKDILSTVERVFRFLGVNPHNSINFKVKTNPARIPISGTLSTLTKEPPILLRKIARFLFPFKSVNVGLLNLLKELNERRFEKPEMDEATREKLLVMYGRDIKDLESLINRDLSLWIDTGH